MFGSLSSHVENTYKVTMSFLFLVPSLTSPHLSIEMSSGAGALLVGIQQCMDSHRTLTERLFMLAHAQGRVTSLEDLRQMLKQSRGILDYFLSSVTHNSHPLSHRGVEPLNHMFNECKTDLKYVSERILQVEQEVPRDVQLLSAMEVHQIWLDFPEKKSDILNEWLKQTPQSLQACSFGPGDQQTRANQRSIKHIT